MDVRSPFFQNIALIVAGVMFLNPIVTVAAELSIDAQAGGNTTIGQAGNGVPIVNIATPNGSGLSHNKFTDYNVGQQGLILNNGAQAFVPTQQGGYITGNPNLRGGAANVILNEVTGSNRSQLKGYTEVAGQAAHVIVANPHGITCDGCGFINTPRATLSTGAPQIQDGRLKGFDVDGGDIAIEGAGLNASNVDQFDLITRSAQINAEIHAKRLNVIAGRNEVDVATLQATAKADDGSSQPQLAIDSSALGGMYAGAIRLVGTEAGVGVKLAGDMAASAGDIQIDASGQLTTNRMAASNDVTLVAKGVELNADTYAGRNATITAAGNTVVKESLAAGSKVEVGGGELDNQGIVEAGVKADGTLVTNSQLVLNSKRVTNRGELIARGTLDATVDELDNRTGKLISAGDATIQAATLDNSQGQLIGQKNLTLKGGDVTNHAGEVVAASRLQVDGTALDNQGGTLAANVIDLKLSGALTNDQGLIESTQTLKLDAGSAQNRNGRLRALASTGQSDFQIGSLFDNGQGLVEIGNAVFSLSSGSLTNVGGTVRHVGTQGFDLKLSDLGGAGGRFTTNGELTLSAADWTNTSELQAERLTLNIGQFTQTATGQLISRQSILANGDSWVNDGVIATDGTLGLTLTGSYAGNGALRSLGDLTFKAASAEFGTDAQVKSGGVGQFELSGQLLNRGRLTAAQDMSLKLGSLDNRGTLGGAGLLRIEGDSLRNEQGLIFSGGDMTLRTTSLMNLLGDIYSLGGLDVARDEQGGNLDLLDNRSASIESTKDMTLRAAVLRNRKDVFDWSLVQTYGHVVLHCGDCGGDHHNVDYEAIERFEARVQADSAASRIHSGENLIVKGGEIANQYSTLSAVNDISVVATSLENTGANLVSVERVRLFNTGRVTDGTEERFTGRYVHPYNAQPLPKTLPSAFYRWSLVSDIQRETPIGIAAPAIIQAGGNVDIRATQPITNAAVMAHNAPQSGSTQTLETSVSGASAPLVVQLNPQLAADKAQQAVDPISLPGFSLPQGQNGLFQINSNPGHRYLIETNPAFANLKSFLNSDYLLSRIGFDPDLAQKRLGDGLYEQRLIEQAVAARTGKRLLDGLTNNDAQFRYLMDNAIASKDALSLSLGVGLSAAQVAALTHDIVWLEEREVQGEKVLVPVLYLAQVGDRLSPSGALIQGQDVALISGGSLNNSGTLRASKNLSATASSIGNSGLMQANERLQLLATESIRNAQGGIIKGQDVSLTALAGDIVNERTISQQSMSGKGYSQLTSVVDKAAGIEAGNMLQLQAGGDIRNVGGSLKAGGDANLKAGGDVIIASAEEEQGRMRKDKRHFWSSTSTTQHGSDVQVGGDLGVAAGQDIAVVASTVKAGGDVAFDAGRDVTIAAAANESSSEYRYKRSGKKVDKADSNLRQQAAVIEAGGDLDVSAGRDLALIASQLRAANDIDIDAGQDVNILSDRDESASYYFKSKKGSFGRSKSEQRESYHSTNVASVIEAGNDLTINTSKAANGALNLDGGRDVTVIGSNLTAGNDLLIGGKSDVAVLSGVEEHGSYSKKTKSGFLGLSKSGSSQLKTSATQVASELEAGNDVVIAAGNDIRLRASTTDAGNDVELRAGLVKDTGDINLVSANDEAYSRSESYKKKFGLSGSDAVGLVVGTPSWGGDIAFSSAKKSGQEIIRSTNVGSQVNAERDASLIAERDINVLGSGVSAGRNVLLDAGRDVNVVAGTSSEQVTAWKNTKTVGLMHSADGNGVSAFAGAESLKDKTRTSEQTAAASQINAGLDLDVRAGRDIRQQGSDMQAGYDLNMKAGRDIVVDSAGEQSSIEREQSQKRSGLGVTVNHNYERTKNAVSGAGSGENTVSQASSTLKAVDSISQFMAGPTFDAHFGSTSQRQSVSQTVVGTRASTLDAGNDINLEAGNDVQVRGAQFQSGRDINVSGRDIALDVARGEQSYDSQQSQGKGGFVGGTSGGFKVGIGGSRGVAGEEGSQGTASAAVLNAERDVNLNARNDLNLIGTQVQAGRDIDLKAGNDLKISAAQNASDSESTRRSGGGEVGFTFGSEGVGVYVSVNVGKGDLEREGQRQQEAYLYAGDRLNFTSGRDTAISGAQLSGDEVIGRVGRDLTVTSLPDTGKVKGREFDVSATATFGPGAGFSASVGYGETTGSTEWVENQTRIVARDRLNIRTEEHTQIDGAVIASNTGNLKLDTGTLGFSDIAGHDKEHSYYLNVGGSYGKNDAKDTQQDKSQEGKGEKGKTGWSVEGYEYEKDRQQIVRATVGEGEIVVRGDAGTGSDSTVGLNRDVSKAYEITRDDEERTDLYVTKSSVEAVANPIQTFETWAKAAENYADSSENAKTFAIQLAAAALAVADGKSIDDIQQQQVFIHLVRQYLIAHKKLEKGTEGQRRDSAKQIFHWVSQGSNTVEAHALGEKIERLAVENPQAAIRVFELLGKLSEAKPNDGSQSLLPLFGFLGLSGAEVLGGALVGTAVVTAVHPSTQESVREIFNSMSDKDSAYAQMQLRLYAELWPLVLGTSFPIHTLGPGYGVLINPGASPVNTENASSGGYNAGGSIVTVPHTGGQQLDTPQGGTSYTHPEHQLNPGAMYSEKIGLKGLAQNRPLQDLTHQEILDVFQGTGFVLSNHAVGRLKDSRTKNIGFFTPNDIVRVFNDGARFDAGNGEIGFGYKGLEAIVDPKSNRVITFRPEKNRGS